MISGGVEDKTGGTIEVSGDIGKISGDILRDSNLDKLVDDLWFELKTTDLNGEENDLSNTIENDGNYSKC